MALCLINNLAKRMYYEKDQFAWNIIVINQ